MTFIYLENTYFLYSVINLDLMKGLQEDTNGDSELITSTLQRCLQEGRNKLTGVG